MGELSLIVNIDSGGRYRYTALVTDCNVFYREMLSYLLSTGGYVIWGRRGYGKRYHWYELIKWSPVTNTICSSQVGRPIFIGKSHLYKFKILVFTIIWETVLIVVCFHFLFLSPVWNNETTFRWLTEKKLRPHLNKYPPVIHLRIWALAWYPLARTSAPIRANVRNFVIL